MHLSGLYIYPVKSMRGVALDTARLDDLGLIGDRRFMAVDLGGNFLTQRAVPRMALIETGLEPAGLKMCASGHGEILVPSDMTDCMSRVVNIWKSEGLVAEDCGDRPAAWLTDILEVSCRLVRIGDAFRRPILKPGLAGPEDLVSFADLAPLLLTNEASLAELNKRLLARGEKPLPMDRFRANLVVSGCSAFAEDHWGQFQIGNVLFRNGWPCARCIITATDQLTGERGREPLRTLAAFRRDAREPAKVNFGQNILLTQKSGSLRVGDRITLLASAHDDDN